MSRTSSRLLAPIVLLAFVLCLSGVPQALAASGSVSGQISVEGGPLPAGSIVRATPVSSGSPLTTNVGSDGSFLLESVPEGTYQFEVVGPDGKVLGSIKTVVPPSPLQLNMRARVESASAASPSAAPPAAAPAQKPPEPAKRSKEPVSAPRSAPASRPSRSSRSSGGAPNKRKWALIGAIVGGFGAGWAIGNNTNNNNNNASPSQP